MHADQIKARIEAALADSKAEVRDLTGTSDHFEAAVTSPAFEGKGMVEQHQMVYGCLQDVLKSGELHALALKTYSPNQWKKLHPSQ